MTSIITRTESCACGGSITIVLPADPLRTALEIHGAVERHNETPEHRAMTAKWASEWLHPGEPGYPYEEVTRDG